MSEITITIGLSRRADSHGSATQSDAKALGAVQQLFSRQISVLDKVLGAEKDGEKINSFKQTTIRVRVKGLPTGNVDGIRDARNEFDVAESFSSEQLDGVDFLYIPGAPVAAPSQVSDSFKMKQKAGFKFNESVSRDAFEVRLIEAAMARGIPILAVCAGSWRLLEAFGGQVRELTEIEARTHYDHGFSANHKLSVASGSSAPGIVTSASGALAPKGHDAKARGLVFSGANTTHWAVAETAGTGRKLKKRDEGLLAGRTSSGMDPSVLLSVAATEPGTGTVEGFESNFGAPIVGTQWHPESFLPTMRGLNERYSNQATIGFSQKIFELLILSAIVTKTRRYNVIPQLKAALKARGLADT